MTSMQAQQTGVCSSNTMRPDEAQLVARIRGGDEAACVMLVRTNAPRMFTVARRMLRCHEDCDDAVQEAFISAFKSIDSFSGQSSLGTWLHRVVINACLMKLRKRKSEVSIESLLPQFAPDGHHAAVVRACDDDDASSAAMTVETRVIVRRCIDQLPEPYRAVLMLRDIEQLDTQETAELLGCTAANVKTRLHRARQALRTLLERQGCLSS